MYKVYDNQEKEFVLNIRNEISLFSDKELHSTGCFSQFREKRFSIIKQEAKFWIQYNLTKDNSWIAEGFYSERERHLKKGQYAKLGYNVRNYNNSDTLIN